MRIPTPNYYPSPAQVLERRGEVARKVFDWFMEESVIDSGTVDALREEHPGWQGDLVEHLILKGYIAFPVSIPVPAASTPRGFPITSPGGFDVRSMSAVVDEVPE